MDERIQKWLYDVKISTFEYKKNYKYDSIHHI